MRNKKSHFNAPVVKLANTGDFGKLKFDFLKNLCYNIYRKIEKEVQIYG